MQAYLNLRRRHQLFVDAYLKCGVGSQALTETGYRGRNARNEAWKILTREDVQKALAERVEEAIAEAGITNHRILTELAKIAFSDVTSMFDEKGNLLPISKWPDSTRAAISGLEVEEVTRTAGTLTRISKFKLADKIRALEILAKYKKLLIDQLEFPAGIPLPAPVFNIGFRNGGPGNTIAKRDSGAEGS